MNTDESLVKAGGSGGEAVNIPVVMVGVDAGELLSQGALVSLGIGLVCVCVYVCTYIDALSAKALAPRFTTATCLRG